MAQTRPQQLADALLLIADANHYMVGLVGTFTLEEMEAAKQILITKQNGFADKGGEGYKLTDLALDLCEQKEKKA